MNAPQTANDWMQRGNALDEQGRFDEACACYERALVLDPDDASVHFNYGVACAGQGGAALDRAITLYRQALQLDPGHTGAHANLGACLMHQGDYRQAQLSFQRAMLREMKAPECLLQLGVCMLEQKQLREAMGAFRAAFRLKPDAAVAADIRQQMSLALDALGYPGASAAHCMEAVLLRQRAGAASADDYGRLAAMFAFLGVPNQVEKCARLALQLDPQHGQAQHLLTQLSSLEPKPEAIEEFQGEREEIQQGGRTADVAVPGLSLADPARPAQRLQNISADSLRRFCTEAAALAGKTLVRVGLAEHADVSTYTFDCEDGCHRAVVSDDAVEIFDAEDNLLARRDRVG